MSDSPNTISGEEETRYLAHIAKIMTEAEALSQKIPYVDLTDIVHILKYLSQAPEGRLQRGLRRRGPITNY